MQIAFNDERLKIEQFKTVISALSSAHENLWIEKEVYRNLIVQRQPVSPIDLREIVTAALSNPLFRDSAREQFGVLWEALSDSGLALLADLLLDARPFQDLPN